MYGIGRGAGGLKVVVSGEDILDMHAVGRSIAVGLGGTYLLQTCTSSLGHKPVTQPVRV